MLQLQFCYYEKNILRKKALNCHLFSTEYMFKIISWYFILLFGAGIHVFLEPLLPYYSSESQSYSKENCLF